MYARTYLIDVPKSLSRAEQATFLHLESDTLCGGKGKLANQKPSLTYVKEDDCCITFELRTVSSEELRSVDPTTMERITLAKVELGKDQEHTSCEKPKELAEETKKVVKGSSNTKTKTSS